MEFTSLLKELLPVVEVSETHYTEAKSASDVESVVRAVGSGAALAVAVEQKKQTAVTPEEEEKEEQPEEAQMSFMDESMGGAMGDSIGRSGAETPVCCVAISAAAGTAMTVNLDSSDAAKELRSILTDGDGPKAIHDYKAAIHALDPLGIHLAGVRHDPMLYSYLLDPTYSSHRLAEVALRRFNLKLAGQLAESADITWRLASALRSEVEQAGLAKLYEEIDLPLVPVLARMEQAGVKIDTAALAQMSSELEREIAAKAKEIYEVAGMEFNVGSPKQLGDVLFNRMNLPKPVKYGKGRTISTAVDVLEELAENHPIARMVLDYRQLTKLKSTYVDALPALINPASGRLHTTFGQAGTATGRLSSANPNLQNIPIRTELGRGIRAAFIAEPGHVLLTADYSQIELRLLAHFSGDPLLVEAYRRGDDIHTLTASQVFGVPPLMVTADHRRQAKVVNFGIVYGLSAFGLSQHLGIEPSEAKQFIDGLFRKIQRRACLHRQDAGRSAPRHEGENAVWAGAAHSRHQQQERQPARIRGAHGGQYAVARHGGRSYQDCDDSHRCRRCASAAEIENDAAGARRTGLRGSGERSRTMQPLVREHMEKVHELTVPLQVEMGVGPNWRDLE